MTDEQLNKFKERLSISQDKANLILENWQSIYNNEHDGFKHLTVNEWFFLRNSIMSILIDSYNEVDTMYDSNLYNQYITLKNLEDLENE